MAKSSKKEGGTLKTAQNTYGKKVVKAAKAYNKGVNVTNRVLDSWKVPSKVKNADGSISWKMTPAQADRMEKLYKSMDSRYKGGKPGKGASAGRKGFRLGVNTASEARGAGYGEGYYGSGLSKKKTAQVKSMARIQKTLGGKKK